MSVNFNFIAPFYDLLSRVVYGQAIRSAQCCYLGDIESNARLLVLGGGTGWILEELVKVNQDIIVDYVEASPKMLEKSRKRQNLVFTELNYVLGTECTVQDRSYDFIITPFVIDVFPQGELKGMVIRIKKLLVDDGKWYCIDFNSRDVSIKAKLLSVIMIIFFRFVSGLKTNGVLDYFKEIEKGGMLELKSSYFYGRFIRSTLYSKK